MEDIYSASYMDGGRPLDSREWLQIDIAQAGEQLRATARGSRGEEPAPHLLGPHLPSEAVSQFAEWVKAAATRGTPLTPPARAQELYQALFREGLQEVLLQLRGAAGGSPLLLRLNPASLELHGVPWEALCRPGTTLDYLGTSPEVCLVRGAHSTKSWEPCRVEGAVRLLVISPSDERAPERLRAALHRQIEAGELEWLPPLTGAHASRAYVLAQLRDKKVPHILHFIGHGGVDEAGHPTLRMADKDGEESWLKVELLAKELESLFRSTLRLVVLEACEGARPGTLSSAAALLGQAGAGAVVAHLWPVRADVARSCSVGFYRSLAGTATHQGDVALSLNDARRSVLADFDESAEAFSPVLYLRGHDSVLFDFQGRTLRAQQPAPHVAPKDSVQPVAAELLTLLQQPFSLLLGDHRAHTLEALLQALREELRETPWVASEALPLSSLAQRYSLQFGETRLSELFQAVYQKAVPSLPLVEALARRLGPGVHVTLLRSPVLEEALVRQQPQRPLYVLQPSREGGRSLLTTLQYVSGQEWVRLKKPPEEFDLERETVLLRLYRGYLPNRVLGPPLLTEDDFLREVRDLDSLLPRSLATPIKAVLVSQPALLVGLSLLSWDHRYLLYQLFRRPLPEGSTVLCEPGDVEAEGWASGMGLPGGVDGGGLRVLQASFAGLAEHLGTGGEGAP